MRTLGLAVALLLSGCAGAAPTAVSPATSGATTIDEASEFGAIHGQVLSEEQMPLPKARVVLVQTPHEATTDERGAFSFSGLVPGTYIVLAERLGFEQGQRQAKVIAGAPTEVQIILVALVIEEPYTRLLLHTGYHNLGQQTGDTVVQNQLGWNNTLCDSCQWRVTIERPARALVYQVTGGHSVPKPTGPAQEYIDIRTFAPAQPRILWAGNQNLPIRNHGDSETMLADKTFEYTLICGGSWICYQERRDTFSTFFFLQDAPADYSALPKP